MTLSDFSIKRPVFAWVLMFGLIFFGVLAFQKMGVNENPDVEYPVITIRYSYEGATPEVIEKDVLEPVESVLVSMQGIRNLSSTSDRGNARITLEFTLDRDIDFALQEVNTLLSRAQRQLPDNLDPPVITKSSADDDPILYATLSSERLSSREIMILFRDQVRDRLSTVDGVAEIRAFGYHEPILRIDLDAKKLRNYQLTASDIVASLRREHKELPAGKLEHEDSEDLLRIMGELSEVSEFQNMVISRRGGSPNYVPIQLNDVAQVYEGIENIRRISRVNGLPSLSMAVHKQRGENAVTTADRVFQRLDKINRELPEGTRMSVNYDRTQFIRESVNELVFTLLLSALLTSLVCWLFIGSLSATVNIVLAIPTAIVGTFIFINGMGFTLNTFSLLGLTLAIGVVVDDAIVMLENIIRYVQNGFNRINAAFKGAREISFAVIATTIALISIFIPIVWMKGIEGRFFFEFVVTLAIAVSLSSLEALTLAPMRCSQFLNISQRRSIFGRVFEAALKFLRDIYESLLSLVLKHKVISLLLAVVLFFISLIPVKNLPTEFAPPQDRGVLFLVLLAPDGKSMEYTDKKAKQFEKIAMAHPAVKRVVVAIGGFGDGGQGNRGNGVIILKDFAERTKSQFDVAQDLRDEIKSIKGIRIFIRDRFGSRFAGRRGSPIEFTINGPSPEKQKELYQQFFEKFGQSDLVGIRSDDVLTLPEVHVVPNRQKARSHAVEVEEIANTINATFGGTIAAQYTKGGRRFDIYVQLKEDQRRVKQDINRILVRNNRGETLPISRVVDVVSTRGPQIVFREDRVRGVRVDASLKKGVKLGTVVKNIKAWAKESLPEQYFIRFSETPQEKLMEILWIMFLGIVVAYMILASQFNSFIDPLIVFLALPFSLTGSSLALWLGNQSLNVYSVIGILLTIGISLKNSILIIEFSNQLRDQGKEIVLAVKEACSVRFRPILMTNVATIAAAIPPALALGPGSETRVPMALTVIGGITLSLMFTIFVVPCVYILVSPKRIKIREEDDKPAEN